MFCSAMPSQTHSLLAHRSPLRPPADIHEKSAQEAIPSLRFFPTPKQRARPLRVCCSLVSLVRFSLLGYALKLLVQVALVHLACQTLQAALKQNRKGQPHNPRK